MTLRGPARPIGLVVAVHEEAQAVLTRLLPRSRGKLGRHPFWRGTLARREVAMIQCGPGLQQAEEATRLFVERQDPVLLISAGLAGGLSLDQKQGDIVVGHQVLEAVDRSGDGTVWEANPKLLTLAQRAAEELRELGLLQGTGVKRREFRVQEGLVVSRDRVLATSREKLDLAEETRADLIDMESRSVVQVAREKDLPWLVVRVISDTVTEDLPLDFNQFVDAAGEPQRLRILWEGVKRPALLGKLLQLERNTQKAGEGLSTYLELLMPHLDLMGS